MKSSRAEAHQKYRELLELARCEGGEPAQMVTMAELGRRDLFFLLVYILHRKDVDRDWLFQRCREVQAAPDGRLDLWARDHYKSTIITFGKTIQDILCDPEITVGIFSHTRPIAKGFLRQIKQEFENNELLKALYPQVLYADPRKEAPKWSENEGIIVRRRGNPKEATVEAWGLVDGQPTSRHFRLRVYDDVVTEESVSNPEMIHKTTRRWELSLNLGSDGGRERYIGTRYHLNDTYAEMIRRGAVIPRLHPATTDGTVEGEPVLLSRQALADKRRKMGPYTFACQMLQDPRADEVQGFKKEWLQFWRPEESGWEGMNLYLLCDPASEKKRDSDYTVLMVVGLAGDGNTYLVDMVRDRLNLTERTQALLRLHRRYRPRLVGYERYGMQADVEHIRYVQAGQNYRFPIVELGGAMPKNDRIRRLIPDFEQGRVLLPQSCLYIDSQKKARDLTVEFIEEEYLTFPVGSHDDMLDCLARIKDPELGAVFPRPEPAGALEFVVGMEEAARRPRPPWEPRPRVGGAAPAEILDAEHRRPPASPPAAPSALPRVEFVS